MKKVICEIRVDESALKENYMLNMGLTEDEYCLDDALNNEFIWLEESGISLIDWRVIEDETN